MRDITNIPAPRVAFIDERTGLMSREWYRFFLNLFVLTGSGNTDVTVEDLQKSPSADVVVPVVDVLPATSVVVDNTETQLAVLTAKYDEVSAQLQDLQLSVPPAGSSGSVTKVSVVTANGLAGTVANPTTTPEITLSTTQTGILTGNGTSISNAVIGTGLQYASSTLSINATTGTEILRGNGSGQFSNITVGTGLQYVSTTLSIKGLTSSLDTILASDGTGGVKSVTIGTGLSYSGGTLSATGGAGSVTNVSVVSANGLAGTVSNPTTTPAITLSTTANGVLIGNGTSISNAVIGTGLQYASSTLSVNATTGTDILRGNGSGQFSNVTIGTGLQYSAGTLSSTINGTFQGVYNASVGSAFATMMTTGDGNKPFYVVGPTTSTANVAGKGQNFQQINYMTGTPSYGGAGIYSQINCSSYGFINPMLGADYAAVVGVAARGTTGTVDNSLLGGLFQTWINSFVSGTQVTATELDCSNEGGYGGLGRAYPECGIGAYVNTASTYSPYAGVQITKASGAGWYNGILLNDINNHAISVGTAAQSSANTPVFDVTGTGTVEWGSGSAAPDTKLYRQSAGVLRSNQNFQVNGNLDLTVGSGTIDFPTAAITTGASTGTYIGTNKPGSNSNNVWLVVKVNGTNYYLPAWT